MPTTYTAAWTTNQTLQAQVGITTGNSQTNSIDFATLGFYAARVQLDLNANAGSPNGDVTVEVFTSPDGGTTVDTIPSQTIKVPFTAQAQKRLSIVIAGAAWARISVTNNVGATIQYIAKYSGLKQTGT